MHPRCTETQLRYVKSKYHWQQSTSLKSIKNALHSPWNTSDDRCTPPNTFDTISPNNATLTNDLIAIKHMQVAIKLQLMHYPSQQRKFCCSCRLMKKTQTATLTRREQTFYLLYCDGVMMQKLTFSSQWNIRSKSNFATNPKKIPCVSFENILYII